MFSARFYLLDFDVIIKCISERFGLSANQRLSNILKFLIDHGLPEYDKTRPFYRTTKKGFR
jgi:hypothetical protein